MKKFGIDKKRQNVPDKSVNVIEKVNSIVKYFFKKISAKGQMLRSEICGQINMKSCLSGMPNLKLGLNDKIFFEVSVFNFSEMF